MKANLARIIGIILIAVSAQAGAESTDDLRATLFKNATDALLASNAVRSSVYAPVSYSEGAKAYQKAEETLAEGGNIESIRRYLADAEQQFTKALKATEVARVTLSNAIQARDDAVNAESERFAKDSWNAAEVTFATAATRLEEGSGKSAERLAKKAEEEYRAAELDAIKANYLSETKDLLEQADDAKAKRYAPTTFAKAKELLAVAEKELTENQKVITAKEKKLLDGAVSPERLSGEQAELLELKKAQNGLASIVGETLPYPAEGLDEGDGAFGFTGDGSFTTGIQWLDKKFKDGMKKADKNPTLLLYKLQSNGYKFAWLLIPLSLPFVWLVTIGAGGSLRPHRFYDHAVFTTYSIAFMSLLFLTCALLAQLGWESAWIAMGIIPPLHLYKHLRHSYALSRLSAVIRLCLMFVCIGIVATLFLLILLVLGVLG